MAKMICSFSSGHFVASAGRKEGTGFGVGWIPAAGSIQTPASENMGWLLSFGQGWQCEKEQPSQFCELTKLAVSVSGGKSVMLCAAWS